MTTETAVDPRTAAVAAAIKKELERQELSGDHDEPDAYEMLAATAIGAMACFPPVVYASDLRRLNMQAAADRLTQIAPLIVRLAEEGDGGLPDRSTTLGKLQRPGIAVLAMSIAEAALVPGARLMSPDFDGTWT